MLIDKSLFVIQSRYHCITVGAGGDSLDRGLVEILAVASLDAGSALLSQLVFLLHHLLHSLAALVIGRWLHGEVWVMIFMSAGLMHLPCVLHLLQADQASLRWHTPSDNTFSLLPALDESNNKYNHHS
jgi:hypothetical protein